jgi:D-glycero-D-manno-heptose 1,7-bisphosphate phosphatase
MLYLFDVDGTLRRARLLAWVGPLATWDQSILPGRLERLRRLHADGHHLGAASNQAAVAMGLVSFVRSERIMQETNRRLDDLLEWIRICPDHPFALRPRYRRRCACRKPAPGMLLEALAHFSVSAQEAIYIGDRDTDRAAAAAAGFGFSWASTFFASAGGRAEH